MHEWFSDAFENETKRFAVKLIITLAAVAAVFLFIGVALLVDWVRKPRPSAQEEYLEGQPLKRR